MSVYGAINVLLAGVNAGSTERHIASVPDVQRQIVVLQEPHFTGRPVYGMYGHVYHHVFAMGFPDPSCDVSDAMVPGLLSVLGAAQAVAD